MKNELGKMGKEVVVISFRELFQHLPRTVEEIMNISDRTSSFTKIQTKYLLTVTTTSMCSVNI